MGTLFLAKEARLYNGAKIASLRSSSGETGELCAKTEIRTLPNTIHKDKFKMD